MGLASLHVIGLKRDEGGGLVATMRSAPALMGCRSGGVVADAHSRVEVDVVDAPAMGRPVRVRWRMRRWVCPEPACPVSSFVEQDEDVAAPRSRLTVRACLGAVGQPRTEHASVNGIRRQLSCGLRTVWDAIRPILAAADADPARSTASPSSGSTDTCDITCRPSPPKKVGARKG